MNVYHILAVAVILFFSVVLHEIAHGWVAYRLGDPTAKYAGRLTFNPIPHIDLMGTIVLPLLLVFAHAPIVFGWAKPVPVNYRLLRHPKRDMVWVGLAGPFVNILCAVILSVCIHAHLLPIAESFFKIGVLINLALAVFNLIPIPPLDGSSLVLGILPNHLARFYARIGERGIGLVVVFLLLYFGVLDRVIWPVINVLLNILGLK